MDPVIAFVGVGGPDGPVITLAVGRLSPTEKWQWTQVLFFRGTSCSNLWKPLLPLLLVVTS